MVTFVRRLAWSLLSLPLVLAGVPAGCGGGSPGGSGGVGSGGGSQGSLCIDAKPVSVVPPAGLQVRFRALDCDGNPVRPLTAGDVTVINDQKGVPFGKGGEGDSVSGVGENSNVELYSVLVLDLSNSIFDAGSVDAVIDGAKAFVDETVKKPQASLKHRVAIIAFGRPDAITLEQDFTQDDVVLDAKLEELRVSPPRGTTDLYDAYMMGLSHVAAAGSGGDTVVERFVVLLTDDTHEAGDEANLRQQALSAKHATDATVYAIGIKGNYDACRLEELAGRGLGAKAGVGCRELDACAAATAPPASCTQFFPGVNQSALSKVFQDVASRATGIARSNYVVGICTPVSLGSPTLTLAVEVDGQKDQKTLPYEVADLSGDVNSCDAEAIQKGQLACDSMGACQIVCLDKQCGTDQGESCGTCGAKQVCNATQKCEDVCAGMNCGTDQGVRCGTCTGQDFCEANVCKTACAGMQCGADHGVACGTCGAKQICNATQQCENVCVGMSCGADQGVACGTCTSPQYCGAGNVCVSPCQGMNCGTDQGVSCGTCQGQSYCSANVCKTACVGLQCGTDHGVVCGTCAVGTGCNASKQCVACSSAVDFAPKVDYPTSSAPVWVTAADLNGDGKPALAIADNASNMVSVLLNNGDGTFAPKVDYYWAGSSPTSVAAADMNGDGEPDLAIVNAGNNTVSVRLNNGNGTYPGQATYPTSPNPHAVAVADLNGDGKSDLAIANYSVTQTVSVLLNNGNGTFAPKVDFPTGANAISVAAADLNGDGKLDLAVANFNPSGTVSVLLNNGNGTFAPKVDFPSGSSPTSVAAADLNGDGKPDLAVANQYAQTVSVLLNNGNGTFAAKVEYPAGYSPVSVAAVDLNGDGKHDLAVANGVDNTVSVLLNNGNGTFAAKVDYATGSLAGSVAVADLSGDGRPDLAVTNGQSNTVSVLLSKCVP